MLTVKFNSVDEFLDELKISKPDPVIRCTLLSKASSLSPNILLRFVIATFVVALEKHPVTLVRLERYCGDTWGIDSEKDQRVEAIAESIAKKIEDTCKELGYEVRPGVYEDDKDGKN
jgi:hypothetical protein